MFDRLPEALPPGAEPLLESAMEEAFGDGLPVIPPTRGAVRRMREASSVPPEHALGVMPPAMREVTAAEAAVCAVAAGCRPAYFPVVVAALQAIMEPEFNLLSIQSTTELASPLLIVNGPAAERLGIHSGNGCLGPGFRANATIGRAVRLAALRLGEARPGEMDLATFGHGGKFSACFAEAESKSPWAPLHLERGFGPGESAVTVVPADAPVNVNDNASGSGADILKMIGGTMSATGSNNAQGGGEVLVVLSPAHAAILGREGYDKEGIRSALFEGSFVPLARFSAGVADRIRRKRPELFAGGDPAAVPVADGPGSILLVVAGGLGNHSLFFPTFGGDTRAVSKPIRL